MDIYPKAGKNGGAYCSGMVGQPTLVLLNHVENAHSLLTLAHEMGHAIVGHFLEHSDPVHKISVISRGQALGLTVAAGQPDERIALQPEGPLAPPG